MGHWGINFLSHSCDPYALRSWSREGKKHNLKFCIFTWTHLDGSSNNNWRQNCYCIFQDCDTNHFLLRKKSFNFHTIQECSVPRWQPRTSFQGCVLQLPSPTPLQLWELGVSWPLCSPKILQPIRRRDLCTELPRNSSLWHKHTGILQHTKPAGFSTSLKTRHCSQS